MDQQRRTALRTAGGLGVFGVLAAAGLIPPREARAAWNRAAFSAGSMRDALAALGAQGPATSAEIVISAPDVAENGAVVSIGVTSTLVNVTQVAILVDKNPNPLAAVFELPEGTQADVRTRIKMAETAEVIVLLRAGGKFLMATRNVQVTVGGCGS
jgi:sulfur-oxidizing protein SoxY